MITIVYADAPPLVLDEPTGLPQFGIGDKARKYHQPRVLTVDAIHTGTGNRPRYRFVEVQGWYSETVLSAVEE